MPKQLLICVPTQASLDESACININAAVEHPWNIDRQQVNQQIRPVLFFGHRRLAITFDIPDPSVRTHPITLNPILSQPGIIVSCNNGEAQ